MELKKKNQCKSKPPKNKTKKKNNNKTTITASMQNENCLNEIRTLVTHIKSQHILSPNSKSSTVQKFKNSRLLPYQKKKRKY